VVSLGTNRPRQKASGFVIALEAIKHVSKVVEGCPVQFSSRPTVVIDTIEHWEYPPVTADVFGRLVGEGARTTLGASKASSTTSEGSNGVVALTMYFENPIEGALAKAKRWTATASSMSTRR
jgi:hypothetical protein